MCECGCRLDFQGVHGSCFQCGKEYGKKEGIVICLEDNFDTGLLRVRNDRVMDDVIREDAVREEIAGDNVFFGY